MGAMDRSSTRSPAASAAGQIALPLDWSADGANPMPLVVGPSNAAALRYLADVAHWPTRVAVLVGPHRSGRSLMAARFAREQGGAVIDDAEGVAEDALFAAWNAAQRGGAPLLLVATRPPSDWSIATPDLASRLAAVPVLRIGDPDEDLALHLIETIFAQRGLIVPGDLAPFIVRRIERSYAAIHAAVAVIDDAALASGRRIGVRLAGDVLRRAGLIVPDLVERADAAEPGA